MYKPPNQYEYVYVNETVQNNLTVYENIYEPIKGRPMYAIYSILALVVSGVLIFIIISLAKGNNLDYLKEYYEEEVEKTEG